MCVLEGNAGYSVDRMFVGHQRELELKMKHQSLDLWALVIEQDKAAIDQR